MDIESGLVYSNLEDFRASSPKSEVPVLFKEFVGFNIALASKLIASSICDYEKIPLPDGIVNLLEMRREESRKWLKVLRCVGFEKCDLEIGAVYDMIISMSARRLSEATKVAIVDYLLNAFLNYRQVSANWHIRGAKMLLS